ncbi:hypothetical protein JOF28_002221 [Leucobacter exalbidus]|uniref:Uncharacterized protein n=1 Tax=Leucobacter exalbidus TaxID=662960 RepID=A0A940PT26_9MICO|nr:hypothetical protein [Leucobacter exalbidus]MBP1326989.1 hypothetical protein [Leucobacter exalbidus]
MKLAVSARRIDKRGVGAKTLAALVAITVGLASLLGFAPAAMAAPTEGLTATLQHNGMEVTASTIVNEGDVLSLAVAYNQSLKGGSTAVFELGAAVTLSVSDLQQNNDAFESVTIEGNTVTIVFKESIPVNQGPYLLARFQGEPC